LVLASGLAIEGRVVDTTGRGVRGVYVSFQKDGASTAGGVRTEGEGGFRLAGLVAGSYVLATWHYPEAGQPKLAHTRVRGIAAGQNGVQIVLSPSARLEGIVLDAEGKPVARAFV